MPDMSSKILDALEGLAGRLSALEARVSGDPAIVAQARSGQYELETPVTNRTVLPVAPYYWVRIKPYNPKKGHKRRGSFFPELGRVLKGGTGGPGDVPEWARVTPQAAVSMSRYHQDDNDPESPLVCDIVTTAERQAIDAKEEAFRMGILGVGMQYMPDAGHMVRDIRARSQGEGIRIAPSLSIEGTQPPTPVRQTVEPSALGGRSFALQGLETAAPPPPPPPGDGPVGPAMPTLDLAADDDNPTAAPVTMPDARTSYPSTVVQAMQDAEASDPGVTARTVRRRRAAAPAREV